MGQYPDTALCSKTVFLALYHGFSSRYLLRTDIFRTLCQAGCRLVILTPNAHEEYFRREFHGQGVDIVPLETTRCQSYLRDSRLANLFSHLRRYVLHNGEHVETVRHRRRTHGQRGFNSPLLWFTFKTLVPMLNRSRVLQKAALALENYLLTPNFHGPLFDLYQPDLVVTTTFYAPSDICILREAKGRGIPTMCVVLSWDNPSTKGLAGVLPDYGIAWTEIMKNELIQYHRVRSERVFVGGIAHFDIYHDPSRLLPREELFKQLGLDPQKRLILFAPWSPSIKGHLYNLRIAEMLGQAVDEGRIAFPAQVLVRLHPHYFHNKNQDSMVEELKALPQRYRSLHLNMPQILSQELPLDMPEDEMRLVGSLTYHADVLLSFLSTMTLEAALCQTPVIHLAFDLPEDNDPVYRPSELSQFSHISRVLATGGVRVAHSPAQMVEHINTYLANSNLDAEGRQHIVQQECQPFDGHSGERIASHILRVMGEVSSGAPYQTHYN